MSNQVGDMGLDLSCNGVYALLCVNDAEACLLRGAFKITGSNPLVEFPLFRLHTVFSPLLHAPLCDFWRQI
jgi:hypothetical protein